MMFHQTDMNELLDFGPTTMAASFKRQTSFEDEVETIFFSNSSKNDQQLDTKMTTSSTAPLTTDLTSFNDMYDSIELMAANPEDVTGQTLVAKVDSAIIEANVDLATFLDEPEEMDTNGLETSDVIKEMEEFLTSYEEPKKEPVQEATELPHNLAEEILSLEQRQTLESMNTECPMETSTFNDEDIDQAEQLLDMLLAGTASEQPAEDEEKPADLLEQAVMSENLHDSGFGEENEATTYDVANVSQFTTVDGSNVIIVVQPSEPSTSAECAVSEEESPAQYDSDSDWAPDTAIVKKKPGRKLEARAPGKVTKRSYRNIGDRKERKKRQNVDAARRYRDRKRQEQFSLETEEQKLEVKNKALKEKLTDIENEMKTMKKLMVELGLLKVVKRR